MNHSKYFITAAALFFLMGCESEVATIDQLKPNIVFIFADDLTYTGIGAMGNDAIHTPNIDRLAAAGTRFTHAYNMGGWNGAICAASRAMLLSGRSLWRANQFRQGWIDREQEAMSQNWAGLMEEGGYDTYMTGKWHIDAPADEVFQIARHIRPGMPRDKWDHHKRMDMFDSAGEQLYDQLDQIMPNGYNRPKNVDDNTWMPTDTSKGGFWQGGKHWSEVLKDDAVAYIQLAKDDPDPFFMYLAFNAPHDPRQAPQEFVDLYPIDQIELPASYLPLYPYRDSIGCGPILRDEALAPFPRTPYAVRKHIQEYYAIISHLDAQIGMILDELEETGKMDNTYIMFTADHGLSVGRHGLIGKQNQYDHSVRVPMIISGPSFPPNKTIGYDVYLQDVMPTSLELANIEQPDYVEFHSLLDVVSGESSGHYDGIYSAYVDVQRMLRKDGFKLIVYPKINKIRLFDLNSDPDEINDLADDNQYFDKIKDMLGDLIERQAYYDDELILDREGLLGGVGARG